MAVVILVLVALMYIIILLGLTIWFEKYHFYRDNYTNQAPTKTKRMDIRLSRPTSNPQTIVNPEHNHRRRVKRGVQGRKNRLK